MVALYSAEITKIDTVPVSKLLPDEAHGRIRLAYFSFTVPVGNAAIADTVDLCEVPAGARMLGGELKSEAMTTGGAAASVQLGDGTTATKYLGTTSIDAAAEVEFGHTVALNYGEKLTGKLRLRATVLTEAWLAGQVLKGHVKYVMD